MSIRTNYPRRSLDIIWQWIASALLGALVMAGAAYLTQRDVFVRNAMTRTEVEATLAIHDRAIVTELTSIHETIKQNFDLAETQRKEMKEAMTTLNRTVTAHAGPEIVYHTYRTYQMPAKPANAPWEPLPKDKWITPGKMVGWRGGP